MSSNKAIISAYSNRALNQRLEINRLKQDNDALTKSNQALWRIINENDIDVDDNGDYIY